MPARPARPSGRRARRPNLTPLLRLIGLIAFAILIVVLLVFWVNGCREDQRKDAYRTTSRRSDLGRPIGSGWRRVSTRC